MYGTKVYGTSKNMGLISLCFLGNWSSLLLGFTKEESDLFQHWVMDS